ncbi:hypothetical protein ACW9I8_01515 [Pseudomonas reactans]
MKILSGIVCGALAVVAVVFFLYFYKFGHYSLSSDQSVWGTFGDFVGGTINPILSFFGLIALLLTIILQGKELELTRRELQRSAEAQERTQDVLDEQSNTQIKLQFEGTFFSLLDQHNRLLSEISTSSVMGQSNIDSVLYEAAEAAEPIASGGDKSYFMFRKVISYVNITRELLKFNFHNAPGGDVGPSYVGNLEDASYPSQSERMYADIIRAHLTDEASILISIYGAYEARSGDPLGYLYSLVKRYDIAQEIRVMPDSPYARIWLEIMGEYQDEHS